MLLADIGNSFIKIYKNGEIERKNLNEFPKEKFFYINVNKKIDIPKHGINIEKWFDLKTSYKNLGIDRIAACYTVKNGVVIDAGSAITVDIMENGIHKGGFILPGLRAYQKSFATISPILDMNLSKNVSLNTLPLNTKDAISFATFGSIACLIERIANSKKIYLTGGDGEVLLNFLKNAAYEKLLVFNGMIKAIKEKDAHNSLAKR